VAFGTNARGVPAIQPPGAALSCVVSPTCDDAPRAGVSRFGTSWHLHHDGSDHELDGGRANILRWFARLPCFHR
jgi:hypothetical protein